jgi:hypothetical protein
MKKFTTKKNATAVATPLSAVAAMFALGMSGAQAQTTPVFDATFPASWNGTSTTVTDQSSAGNTGFQSGTATYTTAAVPAGAAALTGSMSLAGAGGIKVTPDQLLDNTTVAADGGFTYNIDFLWNGTAAATQKLIDYAGTESLQLVNATTSSATLEMVFGGNPVTAPATSPETVASSTTIAPNTWYDVTMTFNTTGNSLVDGDISGVESLYVNDVLVGTADATKGSYGDSLDRPIAIGELGYGHTSSYVGLDGDIYTASVDLGVPTSAPEPTSTALLGVSGALAMAWNLRRRKV